ncbi:hypothetical protein [Streptococcus pneumoniae]|uniref:hypothetical protein n=1 Tax=Streptococcus pneumoniae TaxID=1313 RepID=UPI0005E1E2DA|nr:hypothetical protein [Streptococcus pneumoniae]CKH14164.1 Uncharacterised protein [Streptococcus pneumoniae]CTG60733.1 putative conjugative element protein [Streptococcus pneumoniae]CTG84152.1 putative conjugative element protein [Streptococcus pneumoniae]CTG99087.1 putative conjugative element protein [Streptococcus pneumoniae]CVL29282.1 Uncharacterised protein [Streptococcus pneumoniae]
MTRVYKSVRLAYEAKVWIDELIQEKERKIQELNKEDFLDKLEKTLLKNHYDELNGLSFNIILKASIGSVIEESYRNTKHYQIDKWQKLRQQMERDVKNVNPNLETTVTPRIYLDEDVLAGLDDFRYVLMKEDCATRLPRLSYIIKLVVYSYWKEQH